MDAGRHTNKAIFPVSSIAFWRWRGMTLRALPPLRIVLLAQRPDHVIFGLAVARLALAAGAPRDLPGRAAGDIPRELRTTSGAMVETVTT